MSKGWDNTALKKLKALMGKGLSTSEIGKKLGISKNAVVGKLNRLGWNAKAGATAAKPVAEKKSTKTASGATTAKKPAAKKAAPAMKSVKAPKAAPVKTTAAKPTKVAVAKKTGSDKTAPAKVAPTKKASAPATKAAAPKAPAKEPKSLSNKTLAMHQRIIQHSLEMANLKPNQCRWPIGDPDSENFHFCGETVFVGKPYCYEHCKQAYQFTPPKKK